MKAWTLLLFGIAIMVVGNWPSIVSKYFPANLILIILGGLIVGWNIGELMWNKKRR